MLMPKMPAAMAAVLGVLKAAAIYVPLNPADPKTPAALRRHSA